MMARGETRVQYRLFFVWEDEREAAWLEEMAREGWHLESVGLCRYCFRKGEPAEIRYRLDYPSPQGFDEREYRTLFKDAGWEHCGELLGWHYFRTPVQGTETPEIFSDAESRNEKYKRLQTFLGAMVAILGANFFFLLTSNLWSREGGAARTILLVFAVVVCSIALGLGGYAVVRLERLRRS